MGTEIDFNSKTLTLDKVQLYLMQGKRTPQNDFEKELLAEIRQIEKEGGVVEIPFNGI